MQFRIRDVDNEDEAAVHAAEARYREHLDSFDHRSERDLWSFFYWDFFHDGWIDRIWFDDGIGTLKLHIWAPNTKRFTDVGGDFEFLNIGFTCVFTHVVHVFFSRGGLNEWARPAHSVGFRYAEINTSPVLEQLASEDEEDYTFSSLLIELEDEGSWLEVVFCDVRVQPDEPVAFELMKANSLFELAGYRDGA